MHTALAQWDIEETGTQPGGNPRMLRRMTIEEEDTVDFEYELDDKGEQVILGACPFN